MNELIELLANVSLALSFLVGLVFGIAQVKVAGRDRRERLGLETLRNFQSREFASLMRYVSTSDLPSTQSEFQALPEDQQVSFIQFAQQMESLGLLVAAKLIDLELVDRTFGSLVTTAWGKYKIVILELRESTADPFLSEYFQWVAERLDRRMREHPRLPFYKSAAI